MPCRHKTLHSLLSAFSLTSCMQVTPAILNTWFDELNCLYFNGSLPLPLLKTGVSRTRLGSMVCRKRRVGILKWRSEYTINISNYYDISEDEFRNVFMHELIHYYISYKGIRDTSPHGRVFRQMMNDMNSRGWHITVQAPRSMTAAKPAVRRDKLYIVLLMTDADGALFATVVNKAYIGELEAALHAAPRIKSWAWYKSCSEYFSTWSAVRTLRARRIKKGETDSLMGRLSPVKPFCQCDA